MLAATCGCAVRELMGDGQRMAEVLSDLTVMHGHDGKAAAVV